VNLSRKAVFEKPGEGTERPPRQENRRPREGFPPRGGGGGFRGPRRSDDR
jgi:hypothetical protein